VHAGYNRRTRDGSQRRTRGAGTAGRPRDRSGGNRCFNFADRSSVRAISFACRRVLRAVSAATDALVSWRVMARGLFIPPEGVEGSGKTTQAASLAYALRREHRPVTITHEPGGTRAGEAIRSIFLDPAVSLGVAAELLLVLADRAQHVREKL